MATTIIGGKNYRWRGKAIKTILKDSSTSCVSMFRKDSMVMVPVNVKGESYYKVTITASKKSGNGALLLNFFGGRNYDGPHIPINITSSKEKDYTVTVPTPKFPNNLPICLRVWRPNDAKGGLTISSIKLLKAGKNKPLNKEKRKVESNKIVNQCNKIKALKKDVIIYFVSRIEQRRVFKYIPVNPDDGFCHVILAPSPTTLNNTKFSYLEDYNDFKIDNVIFGDSIDDFQLAVDSLDPVAFVCGTLPNFYQISIPKKCKRVFVSHGLVGQHAFKIDEIKKYSDRWKGCDLYCGAGKYFKGFIEFMTDKEQNISENALPQFDILYYEQENIKKFEEFVKNNSGLSGFDKYILFAGFGGAIRSDFTHHNEDYYRTAIHLNSLAKKNNWFVFIKQRLNPRRDIGFLTNNSMEHFVESYESLYSSNNICMVHRLESIYKYFFCDIILLNGTSTVEAEAAFVGKPLAIVRTEDFYDPLDTIKYGAAIHIKDKDINSLEAGINKAIKKSKIINNGQKKLLDFHNISFDGNMGKRTYDSIMSLFKGDQ